MTEHNYADKTAAELDDLAEKYFRLHAEARRAFKETENDYWDQAMKEYMGELVAIDKAQMSAETVETGEVAL